MMKKIIYYIIIFISFFIFSTNVFANEFNLNSKNVLLYNLNEDTILYENNSDTKTSIASLTKIVTATIVIENIDDLDSKVTITHDDLKGLYEANASMAGYKENDETTYRELLYGLMLPSGADAANCLARNVAGSKEKFVEMMNKLVIKLDLKNTHFANPTGLDDDENYSTLEELATIFKYALKNKEFKDIVSTMQYKSENNNLIFTSTIKRVIDKYNLDMDYLKGGKTGTTGDAGLCLASIASYDGVDYMLITTNAPYIYPYNYHILDAKTLYEYYINNYSYKNIVNKNDDLITIKTKYSNPKEITFKANKIIKKYLKNDFNIENIRYEYEGINEITPLNKKGDKIGKVNIIYNDTKLDTIDIILDRYIIVDIFSYYNDNKMKCILIISTIGMIIFKILRIPKKKKRRRKKRKRKNR